MSNTPKPRPFEGTAPEEQVISFEDIFQVARKRFLVILFVTVLFTNAAVGFSLSQPPMYEASMKMLVAQREGDETPGNLAGDLAGLQQLTNTVAEAIQSRPIAETVVEEIGLDTSVDDFLADHLGAEPVTDTQFVQVTYTDSDPQRAASVANTVGEVFSERISDAIPNADTIRTTVWEPAVAPENPAGPGPAVYGLIASLVGLLSGLGLAFFLEYRGDSLRSPEEAEQICGAPTFGTIPKFAVAKVGRKAEKDKNEDVSYSSKREDSADE